LSNAVALPFLTSSSNSFISAFIVTSSYLNLSSQALPNPRYKALFSFFDVIFIFVDEAFFCRLSTTNLALF
jgi:hypothetical protein